MLVEIADEAERDALDALRAQAGVVRDDDMPLGRRKWSEVKRGYRANFDIDADQNH